MSQISPLPPIASIPSTRDELVKQLARHDLLDPLIKAQAEANFVSEYQLSDDQACTSDRQAIQFLNEQYKFKSDEQFSAWRAAHKLNTDLDLYNYAHHSYKKNEVLLDLLDGSGESLFLRYKDRLDRVLYSLIRVESEDLAYALYYAIESGDKEFGDAAAEHSIGPESKTQGIIGPVDLTTPHPEIAARLRTATPRQLFSPFEADQWKAVVRLDYRFDSEYDENTKRFLGSLVLSAKAQEYAKLLRDSYLPIKQEKQ